MASKLGKVLNNQAKSISFNWLPKKFIFFKVFLLGKVSSQDKSSNLLL